MKQSALFVCVTSVTGMSTTLYKNVILKWVTFTHPEQSKADLRLAHVIQVCVVNTDQIPKIL